MVSKVDDFIDYIFIIAHAVKQKHDFNEIEHELIFIWVKSTLSPVQPMQR